MDMFSGVVDEEFCMSLLESAVNLENLQEIANQIMNDQFPDSLSDSPSGDDGLTDVLVEMVVSELEFQPPKSEVVNFLTRCNNDVDATIRELRNHFTPAFRAEKSTQDAMVEIVEGIVGKGRFTPAEIRRALKTCGYDENAAIDLLTSSKPKSKAKLNDELLNGPKKSKGPTVSKRRVNSNQSFAAIAKKGVPPPCSSSSSQKLECSVASPSSNAGGNLNSNTDSVVDENETDENACDTERSEEDWRCLAHSHRMSMINDFKRACTVSRTNRPADIAHAGVIGARALEAKERYLYAQRMVEIHVFNRLNGSNGLMFRNQSQRAGAGSPLNQLILIPSSSSSCSPSSRPSSSVPSSASSISFSPPRRILKIDFHGVSVAFALEAVELIIPHCRGVGGFNQQNLVFVVGRGSHSKDGVAKIKPAVVKLLTAMNVAMTVSEGEILVNHL